MIRCVGASVQGASHQRLGLPCQDAHLCTQLTSDTLLMVLADGAGSAERAQSGAECAVQTATQFIASRALPPFSHEADWQEFLWQLLCEVHSALTKMAEQEQREVRDFATTLLCALWFPQGVVSVQVGDGAVVLRDPQGDLSSFSAPHTGEYWNETRFVTDTLEPEDACFQWIEQRVSHIALFSDGLQNVALQQPEGIPHPPFFTPLFQFVAHVEDQESAKEQLAHFLGSPRLQERADDDLTLVLATRGVR